ncbi:MAG: hypothetical protein WC955_07550 [Elusimicrobiota bacterium]
MKILFKAFIFTLFCLGILHSIHQSITLKLHYDNIQILDKAILFVDKGVLTNFGNASTGSGYIPGSFQTVITAWPMKLWFSPYAAIAVIILFHVLSLLFLCKVALKATETEHILIPLMLIYWLNPWRVEQTELYNIGYLFLFAALHLWTAFNMREKLFWKTFLHIIAIGFCAQVHFSFAILLFLSVILVLTKYIRINWWGVIFGMLVIGLSLTPYLIEYFSNPSIKLSLAQSKDMFIGRNLLLVYPVIKAVLYWIRYSTTYFGRQIFSMIDFNWINNTVVYSIAYYSFHILKWVIAAGTVWWSIKINKYLFVQFMKLKPFDRKTGHTHELPMDRLYLYTGYLFIAVLAASALSPVEFNHWHLILCFPAIALVASIQLMKLSQNLSKTKSRWVWASITIFFLMVNIFAALDSRKHFYKNDFHQDFMNYYHHKNYKVWD